MKIFKLHLGGIDTEEEYHYDEYYSTREKLNKAIEKHKKEYLEEWNEIDDDDEYNDIEEIEVK